MIEYLNGKCVARSETNLVISVNGVGYGIEAPAQTIAAVGPGDEGLTFWVHTRVREDALKLYGFATLSDRKTFETLLSVSGVGPKVALGIISSLTLVSIKQAVMQESPAIFATVPGIGKRLSEKILVELKSKIDKLALPSSEDQLLTGASVSSELNLAPEEQAIQVPDFGLVEGVKSALKNLGFMEKEITLALAEITRDGKELDEGTMIRDALLKLNNLMPTPNTASASKKKIDLNKLF